MYNVVKQGDKDTQGNLVLPNSNTVYVNGVQIACLTDPVSGSGVKIVSPGSSTVFANFKNVSIDQDLDEYPAPITATTTNVFAGDTGSSQGGTVAPTPLTKTQIYAQLDPYNQPTVSRLTAAEQHDDDPESDPIYRQYRVYAEQDANLPPANTTPVQTVAVPTVTPPASVPTDCVDIQSMTSFPDSFQLSTHFTLGMLTDQTLVSYYHVQPQFGLTTQQIICNLRALCNNILEPMLAKYGPLLVINSGFRIGNGFSQHYIGQAVDVSFTDVPPTALSASLTRAQEIAELFNYDQYIYEQNLSIWYHISYNPSGKQRRQVLSKPRGSQYYPGLVEF